MIEIKTEESLSAPVTIEPLDYSSKVEEIKSPSPPPPTVPTVPIINPEMFNYLRYYQLRMLEEWQKMYAVEIAKSTSSTTGASSTPTDSSASGEDELKMMEVDNSTSFTTSSQEPYDPKKYLDWIISLYSRAAENSYSTTS